MDLYGRMLLSSESFRLLKHHTLTRIIRTSCAVKPGSYFITGLLTGTYHRCHEYALGQSLSVLMFRVRFFCEVPLQPLSKIRFTTLPKTNGWRTK